MYKVDHRMKNIEIALVIAIVDMAAGMEVFGKNIGIFINGSVLNDGLLTFPDDPNLVKPAVEEIDLKMKRPTGHVFIKVTKIRVRVNRFIQGSPPVMFRQLFGKSGFS